VAEALRLTMPAARLRIVGDGWLTERVRKEIRSRSLSDTVHLAGHIRQQQMEATYTSASVLLFTSLRDSFGVQNLEAMSYGLPIVFRDSRGVSVSDFAGTAAIPVPNGDGWATEAARAITKLLQDPESWQTLSTAALTAAKGLTWTAKAERAVTLYEQALRPSRQ
jgi:glycosyltransferase involved in cell wall biosynthesis